MIALTLIVLTLLLAIALRPKPVHTGRPAGAWLAARQQAPVWGDIEQRREIRRPNHPYDQETESTGRTP